MKNAPMGLLLIIFMGCAKDKIYYLTEEQKQVFAFQKGSYWIYKDSISGREDSCFIDLSRTFITDDQSLGREFDKMEVLQIGFVQVSLDRSVKDTIFRQTLLYKSLLDINGLKFKLPITNETFEDGNFVQITKQLGNYALLGKEYQNVLNINVFSKSSVGTSATSYWFNEVGFLKILTSNDSNHRVWQIDRYSVKK